MINPPNRPAQKSCCSNFFVQLGCLAFTILFLAGLAIPLRYNAIKDAVHKTAQANMLTIGNAEWAYKLQHKHYTTNLLDLATDLGRDFGDKNNPAGPELRWYRVITQPGYQCKDGQGNTVTVPHDRLAVESSEASDGCYILDPSYYNIRSPGK